MKSIIIGLIMIIPSLSLAQSSGPNSPQNATYSVAGCLACPGGEWTTPINVSAADSQFADVNLTSAGVCFQTACYYSRFLYANNFGFTIPTNATILGVKAEVLRKASGPGVMADSAVNLLMNAPVGIPKTNINPWPTSSAYVSYGDSTDLWGYNLTPDSINSIDFGLALCVENRIPIPSNFTTASVDHIRITVWYSTGTGIESITKNSNSINLNYDAANSSLNLIGKINPGETLSVFDITGRCVGRYKYTGERSIHNISLQPGKYFWRCGDQSGNFIAVRN